MKFDKEKALRCAIETARRAGALMRRNHSSQKIVNEKSHHDIKLELDVRCQKLIERMLLGAFPESEFLGEEGGAGETGASLRWVVDPIDGTVNFAYGVPHACVSIALQRRMKASGEYGTVLGVVYDPFCDELFTAVAGGPAKLNGRIIHASRRKSIEESIVAIGFSKTEKALNENLPVFNDLVRRARKVRIMGAAALSLSYVAAGRFDGYIEAGVSLWDIAAAGLILERAGGEFWRQSIAGTEQYRLLANNGLLRKKLQKLARAARSRAGWSPS